ncbi:MAG: ORF6N domain-containing protein [Campylobacterales bacterium]|nr:ORF6N domain-containing protein [Campylobacterales bacterium]
MSEMSIQQNIEHKIFTIRGVQVMIDRDLAELYGVEPKRLGEQVKRNIERFPEEFRFQLNESEKNELVANCDRLQPLKHSSALPYVFTEQGVSMLSAVLRSDTAIQTSINIINSFVKMRKYLLQNASLFQRVEKLELDQKQTNQKLESVLNALENRSTTPKQGVFFDGQIFDAYALVSELVKKAKSSIVLIDNYIDESTLKDLGKKWFAFSLLEEQSFGLMERVRKAVSDE